jgi:hypothetical protein
VDFLPSSASLEALLNTPVRSTLLIFIHLLGHSLFFFSPLAVSLLHSVHDQDVSARVSVILSRLARCQLLHCHPLKRFSQTFTQNVIPLSCVHGAIQLTSKRPGIILFSIVRTPTVVAPPPSEGFLSLPESSFSVLPVGVSCCRSLLDRLKRLLNR